MLVDGARVVTCGDGETVVRQGDVLSSAVLLLEGRMRVFTLNEDGKAATLYNLAAGEICLLSLNAAFTSGRYPAWVSVSSASARYALLPGKRLREMFSQQAAVQELVLASLTATIHDLLTHLDEVLLCSLAERLWRYLLRNAGADGRIRATHQALADHLGVTREAVSRELIVLRRRKRIVTGRGYVELPRSVSV